MFTFGGNNKTTIDGHEWIRTCFFEDKIQQKRGCVSKINAALHIVKDWQWRRVAGRRRSLRGADTIVCQGNLRKERGFHRFWGH